MPVGTTRVSRAPAMSSARLGARNDFTDGGGFRNDAVARSRPTRREPWSGGLTRDATRSCGFRLRGMGGGLTRGRRRNRPFWIRAPDPVRDKINVNVFNGNHE